MKVSIIGGGNMGCAIGYGAAQSADVTIINRRAERTAQIAAHCSEVKAVTSDYSSLTTADVVIFAVKPWDLPATIESIADIYGCFPLNDHQCVVSVAAGISLRTLQDMCGANAFVYNVMPNIAAAVGESMTFVAAHRHDDFFDPLVVQLFSHIGRVEMIPEDKMAAAGALCSCGTAFAFRYIRASMEGGIELGLKPQQALEGVLQTIKGAVALLERGGAHPEAEIDKVTTAGGITIRGLNEMEHAGFTSAVIRGLKASCR